VELYRIFIFIAILLYPFAALSSVAGAGPGTVITQADNGKEITVSEGEVFEVRLERSGGTGYSWEMADPDETHLKVLASGDTPLKDGRIVGGPVLTTWQIKAVKAGNTQLKILLYRPWEGPEKAAEKFQVNIQIK
jgi:predicted secreted protein